MVVVTNLIWNCNTTEEKECAVLKELLEAGEIKLEYYELFLTIRIVIFFKTGKFIDTKLAEDWKNLNETKVKAINEKFSKDLVNTFIFDSDHWVKVKLVIFPLIRVQLTSTFVKKPS